jgi:hypothetical protein
MRSPSILLENDTDPQAIRGCGAACLSFVYKSFGREIPQAEIWPLISKPNRLGFVSSTTHLMTLHALGQGLSAVAIQARHPIQVLRLCRGSGIQAILNQRPRLDADNGHYTVLVDIDDRTVVVHDPALGPSRRISHAELMQLWQPSSSHSEIAGNILIGMAADPAPVAECEFCHTRMPSAINCPNCGKPVGLNPAAMLGCIRDGCIARMWDYVACPACDFLFNEAGPATAEAPRAEAPSQRAAIAALPELDKAFAQLDKLCNHMLSMPGLADHADLRAQLDFINTNKDRVRVAQIQEFAAIRARLDRLTAAQEQTKKRREEQRKKKEKSNAPLPPLDGNALGHALLKNLGFKY